MIEYKITFLFEKFCWRKLEIYIMFYLFQAEKRLLESQKRHLSYVLNVNIKLIKLHLVILILYTEKAISKTCVLYVCTHPRVLNTHTHTLM